MKNVIKFFASLFNQNEGKAKAELARKEQEETAQAGKKKQEPINIESAKSENGLLFQSRLDEHLGKIKEQGAEQSEFVSRFFNDENIKQLVDFVESKIPEMLSTGKEVGDSWVKYPACYYTTVLPCRLDEANQFYLEKYHGYGQLISNLFNHHPAFKKEKCEVLIMTHYGRKGNHNWVNIAVVPNGSRYQSCAIIPVDFLTSLEREKLTTRMQNQSKREGLKDTQLIIEDWNPANFPVLSGEKVFFGGVETPLSRWFEIYKDEDIFIWALPEKDYGEPRYPNYPYNWEIFRPSSERAKMENEFIEIYVRYAKILVSYNKQKLLSLSNQGQYLTANLSTVWLTMAPKYKMIRREFVALHEAVKPRLQDALKKAFS